MPEQPTDLEAEIHSVIENGTFIDMRHLLDTSTVTEALIGVNYIQEYRSDPDGIPVSSPDTVAPLSEIKKTNMKYYQS
jgi:hypothetical protein